MKKWLLVWCTVADLARAVAQDTIPFAATLTPVEPLPPGSVPFGGVGSFSLMGNTLRYRVDVNPFGNWDSQIRGPGPEGSVLFELPLSGRIFPLGDNYGYCWFSGRVEVPDAWMAELFRYADAFVVAFGWRHEAETFERELNSRLAQFGLEVAPDKTQTLRFGRHGGGHHGRFDFLGFEFRWEKSRAGRPVVKRRTSPKKLRAAVARFTDWIRTHRHDPMGELMETVRRNIGATRTTMA